MLYFYRPFYVAHSGVLAPLVSNKDVPIRRLVLARPHSECLRLFDTFSSGDIQCGSSKTADRMQNLDLDYLKSTLPRHPLLPKKADWTAPAKERLSLLS